MAVMMRMDWDGVTMAQYDAVRQDVAWETDQPKGGLFHVAAQDDTGLHVNDLWESAEDFQNFVDQKLMPGAQRAGIAGEPRVQILPVHAVYEPSK